MTPKKEQKAIDKMIENEIDTMIEREHEENPTELHRQALKPDF